MGAPIERSCTSNRKKVFRWLDEDGGNYMVQAFSRDPEVTITATISSPRPVALS